MIRQRLGEEFVSQNFNEDVGHFVNEVWVAVAMILNGKNHRVVTGNERIICYGLYTLLYAHAEQRYL